MYRTYSSNHLTSGVLYKNTSFRFILHTLSLLLIILQLLVNELNCFLEPFLHNSM
jgi:hypothetical protein